MGACLVTLLHCEAMFLALISKFGGLIIDIMIDLLMQKGETTFNMN